MVRCCMRETPAAGLQALGACSDAGSPLSARKALLHLLRGTACYVNRSNTIGCVLELAALCAKSSACSQ